MSGELLTEDEAVRQDGAASVPPDSSAPNQPPAKLLWHSGLNEFGRLKDFNMVPLTTWYDESLSGGQDEPSAAVRLRSFPALLSQLTAENQTSRVSNQEELKLAFIFTFPQLFICIVVQLFMYTQEEHKYTLKNE